MKFGNKEKREVQIDFNEMELNSKGKNFSSNPYFKVDEDKTSQEKVPENYEDIAEKVENISIEEVSKNKKKKIKNEESTVDKIIEELGINRYNMRIYTILSLFFLADGAEMIVISLLITKLGEEWSLNHTKKGIMGSAVFVGFFIGALLSGKLADTKGRKPVFIFGSLIVAIFSTLSAFAFDYYSFLALRAINGFGIGMSIPSSTSLATEITPKAWRAWVLNMVWIFFPFGEVFAVFLAKGLLDKPNGWRYLLGFAGVPTLIAFIISFFIFESPKFYLATKQYDKAFQGLNRIHQFKNLPELSNEIQEKIKKENDESLEISIKPNFSTLLKKKYLGVTIKCCCIFYVCSFVYYGVVYILPQTIEAVSRSKNNFTNITNSTLNTTYNLTERDKDEMYRGVIYSSLSELPSTFITGYLANIPFLGRIGSMGYGLIFTMIASLLCGIFLNWLSLLASILKFAIDIPFGIIYIYVSEAYPTKIRSIAIGVTNSFNRIGGITTPIFSQLAFSWLTGAPYYMYAFTSLIAAFITFLLPFETLGRNID